MPVRCLTAVAIALAVVAATSALPTDARAQTAEQQAACQGDAQYYCSQYIPDHELIRRCLAANMKRISPACRAQFTKRRARR
jgi:hypothetical protein